MQLDAFKDVDKGVYTQFQTDGGLFNLKCLHSRTKTLYMLIRDLYADDCALVAYNLENIQQITNTFTCAAQKFGLTISVKGPTSCTNLCQ